MWRYRELLPVVEDQNIITLGEGFTPILRLRRIGDELGLQNLYLKDESQIPTGSFKARGLSVAISKAKELGITKIVLPTAGNAGSAAAAYGARASVEVHVFAPKETPEVNRKEIVAYVAELHLVDGLISDAGKMVTELKDKNGWFDVSTLKEPYRVEGKKTMGFELAEQLHWILPDAIVFPTGGGTGVIGIWKAFGELEALGWISDKKPKMFVVQSSGCAPLVKAFEEQKGESTFWQDAQTIAAGLCVPKAFADRLILKVIRESGGGAVEVADGEIMESVRELAQKEGILVCPEGGATVAALKHLKERRLISEKETIVVFNTGSALKYMHLFGM
jgi:threonine synthase